MVSGKGGSGKSSILTIMARILSKHYQVYIIDSDESNALLHRILGVGSPRPIVEYLGGKKSIFKQGEVNLLKALASADQGIELKRLPSEYISTTHERINLITIGKVRAFGEGCACPLNFLTRALLKNLVIREDEFVLVDTDAGMEYIGRAVTEGIDAFMAIADPTAESLVLLNTIKKVALELDKKFWFVLNKVTPDIVDKFLKKANEIGFVVSGTIRFDNEVFNSCLDGVPLRAKVALDDVEELLGNIGLIDRSKSHSK
jgi:CO dehydrogenase maturation factor